MVKPDGRATSLNILYAAMRAYTLAVKRMATIAADVVSSIVTEILAQGEIDISHQQRIAYIIEGEHAEHHIVDRANCQESQQIEHSLTCRQHAQNIVESCNGNDKDGPDSGSTS